MSGLSKQSSNHQGPPSSKPLVVGLSSRVLFDLSESHTIFTENGLEAFQHHQVEREDEILPKGPAFDLVEKLLQLNSDGQKRIEIVLISRNSADTGLRIFNSIEHYQLPISRAAFRGGRDPFVYIEPFGCQLFLSADGSDVRAALQAGFAAAQIISLPKPKRQASNELRIAFDGDAVLFSDEAERVFQQQGLDAFHNNEKQRSKQELPVGPFKGFLEALNQVQQSYQPDACPIRTALVTARSAPAHKRVILTLRSWDIRIDESLFLGGLDKRKILEAFQADIFFDDQTSHCTSAAEGVTTGHVPYGVKNEVPKT